MECLERSIIQLDILEVGQTYRVITNEGRYSRDMELELVGCFRDHYLFKDSLGRKESFLKTDFFSGGWKIKGINPKKILREAAEKLRGQNVPTIKEGLEMAAEKNREELIEKCIKWLENHPGEELYIKSKYHTYNLDYVQAGIIRDTVLSRMKREGKNVVIEGNRPKVLVYRPEENETRNDGAAAAAETVNALNELTEEEVENIEVEEESEIEMTQEEQLHPAAELSGDVVSEPTNNKLHATIDVNRGEGESISDILRRVFSVEESDIEDEKNKDRKFLIEKAEELQLRITDSQERLDQLQTRLTAEIDIYQELLEEIQEHLEA